MGPWRDDRRQGPQALRLRTGGWARRPPQPRAGVLWDEASQTDILFITLRKSETLFSPTTRYRDLALGPSLFHWESQSITSAASATGQRTIHQASRGSRVLLLVREHRKQDGRPGGGSAPPSGVTQEVL